MTPIASLRNLQKLNLASNRILAVPRLASTGLRELYLTDNLVSDVSLLTNLQALTNINLRNNRLADPSPLGAMPALTTIDLRGNLIIFIHLAAPTADRSYLGGNPICQQFINHPPIFAACKRVPIFVFHDIGILHNDLTVLQPDVSFSNCGSPGSICPQLRVRPFVNQ